MSELMQWQPIETAPKDGTAILLFDADSDEYPIVVAGFYYGSWFCHGQNIVGEMLGYEPSKPTHWMPLPAVPEGER